MGEINFVAAAIGGVLHFILGWVWYAPKFLGNAWMASIGLTAEQAEKAKEKGMVKAMVVCLISALLIALSTAHFIALVRASSISQALGQIVCPLIGFVLAPIAMGIEFEQRKWTYFLITGGYLAVGMAITSVITILL